MADPTPIDPKQVTTKDPDLLKGMKRLTSRVGVVACLNRKISKQRAHLFGESGEGLTFGNFVRVVEPSICEVLEQEGSYWYKVPVVPTSESTDGGYVLDAQNPFIELGKGTRRKDDLTNGATVLQSVCDSLDVFTRFQHRGNDLLDLFGEALAALNQHKFEAPGKKLGQPLSGYASGAKLPDRFLVPFVNFLFDRDPEARLNVEAIWPKAHRAADAEDKVWGKFAADAELQQLFADLAASFKAVLQDKTDQKPHHPLVRGKVLPLIADKGRKNFAGLIDEFRKAFDAYHYVGQVLRSKVLLMSVAEAVVRSYFPEPGEPTEATYAEVWGNIRGGNGGFPPPVKRLPEKHRERLKQSFGDHLEFLLRDLRMQAAKGGGGANGGTPSASEAFKAIASRLKAKGHDLAGKQFDEPAERLLTEGALTKAERTRLSKIVLTPDEKQQLQRLREAGMKLPEGDWEAVLTLRGVAGMAEQFGKHLATLKTLTEDDDQFTGLLTANKNLISDVVCPIVFAAPGLTPEQMVALFKQSVNAAFINAVLLDDEVLQDVIAVANTFQTKVANRLEDYQPPGATSSINRLKSGQTLATVLELTPALLNAVLKRGSKKLQDGLAVLKKVLPDYVRRLREAAAAGAAGPGQILTLKKRQADDSLKKQAQSAAEQTRGATEAALVTVADQIPQGLAAESLVAARRERQQQLVEIAGQARGKLKGSGPQWLAAYEAVAKTGAGKAAVAREDHEAIHDATKESVYSEVARAALDAAKAEHPEEFPKWEYEQLVQTIADRTSDEVHANYTAAEKALDNELGAVEKERAGKRKALEEAAEKDDPKAIEKAEKELEAAEARLGQLEDELAVHRKFFKPDPDRVRRAVEALGVVKERKPKAAPEPTWGAFLRERHADDLPAPGAKTSPATWESLLGEVRKTASEAGAGFDNIFQTIYDAYAEHATSKPDFANEVRKLGLLHLMLLSEPALDLGAQMSEYYALLIDLVKDPDFEQFRKKNSLTKYFDLQDRVGLTRLYTIITGASRRALEQIRAFVSELLGFEHLFDVAARQPGSEVVVWNMTADEFLQKFNARGDEKRGLLSSFAARLVPTALDQESFLLPSVLYLSDSAFGYDEAAKARFLEGLNGRDLKYMSRVLVPPPVVVSFAGVTAEAEPGTPGLTPVYEVPAPLTGIRTEGLAFPFWAVGPSRLRKLSESFLTYLPAGFELLGYLLGKRPQKAVGLNGDSVNIDFRPQPYLKVLSLTSQDLGQDFDSLMWPQTKKPVPGLWADLFLHALNVMAVYLQERVLTEGEFEFDADQLTGWFELWIDVGRPDGGNTGKAKKHLLNDAFWAKSVPADVAGGSAKLLGEVELVPVASGDPKVYGMIPEGPLAEVRFSNRRYTAEWFNRLWIKLGPGGGGGGGGGGAPASAGDNDTD